MEYEVVLAKLDFALMLATTKLEIKSESHLLVRQIQQEYKAKDECMARCLALVEERLKKLNKWFIKKVSQEDNGKADTLARVATTFLVN